MLKWRGEFMHTGGDLGQGHFAALGEGVGGVAIGAAQIAGREPDKNAGQPGKSAFPLQAQIDFVDGQATGHGRIARSSIRSSLPIALQVFFGDVFGRNEFVMLFGADPDGAVGLLEFKQRD